MRSRIFFASLAALLVFSPYDVCKKTVTVPEELIGVWKASEPKYEGCFFELTKDKIIFGNAKGNLDSNIIGSIKSDKALSVHRILYTISYVGYGQQDYKLYLYYYPREEKGGVIRFKNQDQIVWRKEKQEAIPSNRSLRSP